MTELQAYGRGNLLRMAHSTSLPFTVMIQKKNIVGDSRSAVATMEISMPEVNIVNMLGLDMATRVMVCWI